MPGRDVWAASGLYQVAAISYKFYRIGVMMGWTESSWGLVGRGVWAASGPGVDPYVDVSASAWVFGIYVLSVFLWSGSFIRANKEHCVPGIKSFGQVKDAGCSMCVHGFRVLNCDFIVPRLLIHKGYVTWLGCPPCNGSYSLCYH